MPPLGPVQDNSCTQAVCYRSACHLWLICLQIIDDGLGPEFLDDAEDEQGGSDSEDSNAEMHYTHDYPDEEDSQSNGVDSSKYSSDGDSW